MKTKTILLMMVLTSVLLSSCKDDDGYSLGKYWVNIATVENPKGQNYFMFTLDNGDRMWTAATGLWGYHPKDGQRIIANYTILSDKNAGSSYNHDVRLNGVHTVLTKDIFAVTPETQDSIGNDRVRIDDIWIGSDYLNVEFRFNGQNKVHCINLVSDALKGYDDGKIHLEFRHNANDDAATYSQWSIASFRLKPLQQEGVDRLTIVIHTSEYQHPDEQTYEVVYRFAGSSKNERIVKLNEPSGNVM
ncbi:MAG: NigD-like protein [Bacteroidales bacterium]|jgi:hypothetical protein|nr:NigD-like protein [Bacteroidales bacterium]